MKIALPVRNLNEIDDHFGHCEFYSIYTVDENKRITDVQMIPSTQGCGCKSNIASTLAANGVSIMLAGGIGGGAINVLNMAGIDVVRGCSGSPDTAVKRYLDGTLTDSGSSCGQHEQHHQNGHEHSCGK